MCGMSALTGSKALVWARHIYARLWASSRCLLGLGLGIYFIVQAVRQQRIMRGLLWRGGINVLRNVS